MTSRREPPKLRTESVPTKKWGSLVARQLLTSDRLTLSAYDTPAPPEGETEAERFARVSRNNGLFISNLLALAVVDEAGQSVFAAAEWDAWLSLEPDDCWPLVDKALVLNGYKSLAGEDVAKNA